MPLSPEQFVDNVKAAQKELGAPKQLLQQGALVVQGNAQRRAHVRRGNLRRSITSRVEGNVAYVGTAVVYAPFQPNDFLAEGMEDSKSGIERVVKEYGGKVLDKVAGK